MEKSIWLLERNWLFLGRIHSGDPLAAGAQALWKPSVPSPLPGSLAHMPLTTLGLPQVKDIGKEPLGYRGRPVRDTSGHFLKSSKIV